MNFNMWKNKPTIEAVEILKQRNYTVIEPEEGELASLHRGKGRLANLNKILNELRKTFNYDLILEGKNILITAGPTQEKIDPIRYLTNRSSGKMGYALAKSARDFGGEVTLISGSVNLNRISGISHFDAISSYDMKTIIENQVDANDFDYIIMAAAVADYVPENYSQEKIKKNS